MLTDATAIANLVYMKIGKPEVDPATRRSLKQPQLELRVEGLRILARVIARCLMKAKAQPGNREDSSGWSTIEWPRHRGKRDES
jgi:hypothetical protein